MPLYYGFSTINPKSQKKYILTDKDLIKQDLLNVINTRRGSRVMQPNVGCIAWELLFEPMTLSQQDDLEANLVAIIANDPRVSLLNISIVTSVNNTITATITLLYVQTNEVETLVVNFDNSASSNATF